MSKRLLPWTDESWKDYLYWQTQDKKKLKRINKLITDAARSPFEGIGKPEPLKENLTGFWSRRIDETNRLVYARRRGCNYHYFLSLPLLTLYLTVISEKSKNNPLGQKIN
jgi:toxin YoeB